jgi:hypothetical protein
MKLSLEKHGGKETLLLGLLLGSAIGGLLTLEPFSPVQPASAGGDSGRAAGFDGVSNYYGGVGWEYPSRPGQLWDRSSNPVRARASGKWHLAWNPDNGRVVWFHGFVEEVDSKTYRRHLALGELPTTARLRAMNQATDSWNRSFRETHNAGLDQDATNGCGNCQ